MNTILRSFLLLCLCAAPASAAAQVLITEIMYDLEGADGGYEWVEITNTGTTLVDVGAWKLFEQGVNHKLTLFAGESSILGPGASALVADKPENVLARYPGVVSVFDSAFSLSNESETLMLKDAAGKVADQVTYRSSLGAKGDGASLHLEGEILTPALPNPGVYPGELVPVVKKEETQGKQVATALVDPNALYAAASKAPTSGVLALLPWLVGLFSIIGIGVAGVLLAQAEKQKERSALVEGFEIVGGEK